jgi:hypothetical protein
MAENQKRASPKRPSAPIKVSPQEALVNYRKVVSKRNADDANAKTVAVKAVEKAFQGK